MTRKPLSPANRGGLPPSPELHHDLRKTDLLFAFSGSTQATDDDDLHWLIEHRRFLRETLAYRATLREAKVVDLGQWRVGCNPSSSR